MSVDAALLKHLQRNGVEACLVGGLALAAWGHARYTQDVDLLTLDVRILDPTFWLNSGVPAPEIRIGDAADPLGGVARISLQPACDLILGRGHAAEHALRTATSRSELAIRVASPLGLSLLKLEAGGPQDAYDLLALLDLGPALGWSDLRAEILGALPRLSPDARDFWARIQLLR